jgi:hypothetical protein
MAADNDTPLARVKSAVAGKPKRAYASVRPADVVALSEALPDDRHTQATLVVARGAAQTIADYPNADPEALEAFQLAGELAELVKAVEESSGAQAV